MVRVSYERTEEQRVRMLENRRLRSRKIRMKPRHWIAIFILYGWYYMYNQLRIIIKSVCVCKIWTRYKDAEIAFFLLRLTTREKILVYPWIKFNVRIPLKTKKTFETKNITWVRHLRWSVRIYLIKLSKNIFLAHRMLDSYSFYNRIE